MADNFGLVKRTIGQGFEDELSIQKYPF